MGPAGFLCSSSGPGWRAEVRPSNHPVSDFDFDVVIGADGRKNTLDGEKNRTHKWELNMSLRKDLFLTHICRISALKALFVIFTEKEVKCCKAAFSHRVQHFLLT